MLALYPNKSQTKTLNNRIYATVKHKNRILEIKHHNDRWPGGGGGDGGNAKIRPRLEIADSLSPHIAAFRDTGILF